MISSGAAEKTQVEMSENDQEAIAQTIRAFADALNRADYRAAVAMMTDDAVFWPVDAEETTGKAPIAVAYERLEPYRLEASSDVEEILVSGDLAVMRGYENFRLEPKAGGDPVEIKHRRAFSILRRQQDGSWKFARGMTNWAAPQRLAAGSH